MGEMIKMVVVLTVLSIVSGGALAFIQDTTTAKIEYNKLQFIKGPAAPFIGKSLAKGFYAKRTLDQGVD